jgi:hypothetical protein
MTVFLYYLSKNSFIVYGGNTTCLRLKLCLWYKCVGLTRILRVDVWRKYEESDEAFIYRPASIRSIVVGAHRKKPLLSLSLWHCSFRAYKPAMGITNCVRKQKCKVSYMYVHTYVCVYSIHHAFQYPRNQTPKPFKTKL